MPTPPIPLSFHCDIPFETMLGSGSRRLCTQCDRVVVDLSQLTESEAATVLRRGRTCVNYRVRDGRVVSGADAPPRARPSPRPALALAVAAVLMPTTAFAGSAAAPDLFPNLVQWLTAAWEGPADVAPPPLGDLFPVEDDLNPFDDMPVLEIVPVEPPPPQHRWRDEVYGGVPEGDP